jgi:TPR repeat protein
MEFPGIAERRARMPALMVAAESGNIDAQVTLAWEYARGEVVDPDITAAWNWFERAAASGQDEALVNRARFLQLRHVPEGVHELRNLAHKGNWKAQFWLARHYQTRAGRLSQLRAVVWLDRSFKNGNAAAKLAMLAQLRRIAPLKAKVIFAGRGIIEMAAMIWRMTRHEQQIDLYEPLMYRLQRKNK